MMNHPAASLKQLGGNVSCSLSTSVFQKVLGTMNPVLITICDLYGWFDWDWENNTPRNHITLVVDPRIPYQQYTPGQEISAYVPRYGQWSMWNHIVEKTYKLTTNLHLFIQGIPFKF